MGPVKVQDSIQGSSFLAIQDATKVIERHKPDLAQYRIEVVRDQDYVVVIFAHTGAQAGVQRNFGVRQGFQEAMNTTDLQRLMAKIKQVEVLDSIEGNSLRVIEAAVGVFQQRHKPDLAQYKITVVGKGTSVVVIFTDKDRQPGTRGSAGARPGFEVELNPLDLRVLGSHFVR